MTITYHLLYWYYGNVGLSLAEVECWHMSRGKLVGESERGIHLGHDVQNSKIDCECRVLNWLDRTVVSLRHNPNPICREWVAF